VLKKKPQTEWNFRIVHFVRICGTRQPECIFITPQLCYSTAWTSGRNVRCF